MTTHEQSDLHVTHINAASFWGFGTTLYGWRPAPDGGHIVTRWITFLFFPIVPLGSYVIDFTKDGRGALDYVISYLGFTRDSLGGNPLRRCAGGKSLTRICTYTCRGRSGCARVPLFPFS